VLLDGIPLNDPFAGYVLWSEVPSASIQSAVVLSGGGAGLFGNQALAGTIFLVSANEKAGTGYAEGSIGNYGTYEANAGGTLVSGPVTTRIFAERFSTSGYPALRSDQRGPVDNTASADSDVFDIRTDWQINANTSLLLETRGFDDERGNGTILTGNDSAGIDASAVLTTKFPEQSAELQLSLYGQHRRFRSTFSSVNPNRTVETPAQQQFDVPANAIGGSAVWSMAAGADHRLTVGGDYRWVDGETNENFAWNGNRFARYRNAGGSEAFAGIFAEDTWSPAHYLTVVAGMRFDYWSLSEGFRKESNRLTGIVSLDSHFPDRDGIETNGRIGARIEATESLRFRGAFYTGFRVPTLNELYRPFRVGNDVTEANPALNPERLIGGEGGMDWQPTKSVRLSLTGFVNRLHDAVGNITIGVGPGTFNPGGFIPAGGVLRQRRNLDLVIAPGFEAEAKWQPSPSLVVKASYLFTHPTVDSAADRSLEGKLLAQTPENVVIAGVDWTATSKCTVTVRIRYNDRQFEDDQNLRTLRPFITVDAGVAYQVSDNLSAAVKVENLLNEEVETGRSADGLVSVGAPRLITLQVCWQL
jgi:outer membrane receptor protein involved in Fe transport